MTTIDGTGFHRTMLADRLATLESAFQALYGNDIDISPSSPDGQWLGVLANMISDEDQLAETIFNARSPSGASGVALARICGFNGIVKKPAQFSTAPQVFGGTPGTVIPVGSLVGSDGLDGNPKAVWLTADTYTLDGGGSFTGQVIAQQSGPVLALNGHINVIQSVISGWTTTSNTADASAGTNAESDPTLRIRRAASVALPSQGLTDSMSAALGQVANVTKVRVYENFTEVVDANGLPPHSINAIVQGGASADIAAAMWLKKGQGCTLVGAQSYSTPDSQGGPQVMRWDTPVQVPIYVIVNLADPVGAGVATAIQNAIVSWGLGQLVDASGNSLGTGSNIGGDVIWSQMFVPINTINGLDVLSLYIGIAPSPTLQANIPIAFNAIATWDASRITVNS